MIQSCKNYDRLRDSGVPIEKGSVNVNPRRWKFSKRVIDTSELSEASDSTFASSRPLSYREIRQSAKSTPIVVSVLADV